MLTEIELEKALKAHRSTVYRLAASYLGSTSDCEDIVQEAFIRLYMRYKPFSDDSQTRAWLIRVTANLCKNHLRSRRSKTTEGLPDDTADTNGLTAQERYELKCALNSLKPDNRAVICLYYYEGLSVQEISKALKISVTAVTTRLQRGREALRKFLSDEQ